MVNALRLLKCVVTARATIAGRQTHATGSLRFIHPYWLKLASQDPDGTHVVIAAFGRPGYVFDVQVNGRVVARATLGKSSWAKISLPTARPGDIIELAGVGVHEFSHAIWLSMTPGRAVVF